MKFKSQIRQLSNTESAPDGKNRDIWLYLVIFILAIANFAMTVGLIRYLSTRQNSQNVERLAGNYVQNIGNNLLTDLNAEIRTARNTSSQDSKTAFPPQVLNNYLSQINTNLLAQVIIVDRDDSIIASNVEGSENQLAFSSEDILKSLQQKLGKVSDLNQPKKLNLEIKQQSFLTQVIPWKNQELGLNWLLIVTIPESKLTIDAPLESNSLPSTYLIYSLPSIVLGLLSFMATMVLIRKSRQSEIVTLALPPAVTVETNEEPKQLLAAKDPKDLENDLESDKSNLTCYDSYSMLANMSHELRSPLNAILGFAQIMEQELPTNQVSQENIAIINRSGERLLSIVNDVVDLAKIETNQLTLEQNNLDFYAWLDNIEQNFRLQACNQDWEFSLIRENELPQYMCVEERRLRQIVGNLVDYCLESTPSANICIAVSSSCGEEIVETEAERPHQKHNIHFQIKNTNFLVATSELATLFDPMIRVQQESKSYKGSSLSLPISHKLAQLMKGELTVKNISEAGESSIVFNLTIQAESITAQELPIQPTARRVIGLKSDQIKYRILVVDDSKTNRTIMSQLLESVGFEVGEAVNGSEAIDVWLEWQPHMIWMDLRMPVMNGCEATERIRSYSQSNARIPIVALSASTLEEEKSLFKAAGCDDFVGKPFSENIIFDKIAQHLGIRYVYEPIILPNPSNFKLTAGTLKIMPYRWLNRVQQAATELDRDLLTQLLQEIPAEHAELRNALQEQVNNFDFDRILNLAKDSQDNLAKNSQDN